MKRKLAKKSNKYQIAEDSSGDDIKSSNEENEENEENEDEENEGNKTNKKNKNKKRNHQKSSTIKVMKNNNSKNNKDNNNSNYKKEDVPDPYTCSLAQIEFFFKSIVIGQDDTIEDIAMQIYFLSRNKCSDIKDRIKVLLFSGVSGCGKTQMAKEIAKLFDLKEDEEFIKYDLTLMHDESSSSILLGSAPGLVQSTCKNSLPFKLLNAIG